MEPRNRHENLPDAGAVPHQLLDLRPLALWQRIRTATLTGASSTLALTSLPPGYAAWRLQVLARSNAAAEGDAWTLTINSDTGANYDYVLTAITGTSRTVAASNLPIGLAEGAAARASCFGWTEVTFYRPSSGIHEKSVRFASGRMGDRSAATDLFYQHGFAAWRSILPIVQLTLAMTAGDFAPGSSAMLWGLRSA